MKKRCVTSACAMSTASGLVTWIDGLLLVCPLADVLLLRFSDSGIKMDSVFGFHWFLQLSDLNLPAGWYDALRCCSCIVWCPCDGTRERWTHLGGHPETAGSVHCHDTEG